MKKIYSFFVVFAVLICAGRLNAQNIYLFYPGLTEGKGPNTAHRDEILLSSVAGGMSQDGNFGPSVVPTFSRYSVTKNFDGSSQLIMKALTKGDLTDGVEIRFYAPGKGGGGMEIVTLKIELKGVMITSYESAGLSCEGCPTLSETISIVFDAIRIGSFSWNKRENNESF